MAAYSNYQVPPQYGQPPPQPFGAPPPPPQQQGGGMGFDPMYAGSMNSMPPPQQQGMMMGQQQQQYPPQQGMAMQPHMGHGSAPRRGSLQRSLSFDPSQSPSANKAMSSIVSFDPYASATQQPPVDPNADPFAPPGAAGTPTSAASGSMYLPQLGGVAQSTTAGPAGASPFGIAPSYSNEEMTTSPLAQSQFGGAFDPHASAPAMQQYSPHSSAQSTTFDPAASTVSDITMFTNAAPPAAATTPTSTAMVPAASKEVVKTTGKALAMARKGNFDEKAADPALIAEQEKIWQQIQARNKMKEIRKNAGLPAESRPTGGAMVPYGGNGQVARRAPPPRTRSMPNPNSQRGQEHSVANGGVAILDPKKDKRKQTRKMKTAGGAVGGAVVGGLVLGPVGVVLGAGGGAAISNKVAKSRDKRKQQEFEQRNFQKGAAQSTAAKGAGAFV